MRSQRRTFILIIILACLAGAGGYLWQYLFANLPAISDIPANLNQPSIQILDRNNQPLYEILPSEGGRHAVLSLKNIPECMRLATIAVEDRNFYTNAGVDAEGMLRALWLNLRGGETIAGGSTITQQVIRSLLLKDEISQRTVRRKIRESLLAWELTRAYSKDDILALYLNQTFYGGFAYGVEGAAQTYFGKPASQLILPECALLAGLPQAPGLYNPFDQPDSAKARQLVVLGLMEKDGFITAAEEKQASQIPLSYNPAPFPIRAPHFVWMVKAQLDELMREGKLDPQASLVVRTTLDLNSQTIAENAVARQIEKFKIDPGMDHHVNNAAVVVLNPQNGQVLALVGSAGYFNQAISGALNMATALRQPGSVFKPFIYAAAFDPQSPNPWTAATPILDVETTFPSPDGKIYVPHNYDEKEHGIVPSRVALASSLNIPAVLTLQKVGIPQTLQLAERLGITSLGNPDQYDLSLALGGGEMNLLELTNAFAAFANRGFLVPGSLLLEIRDADGNLLYSPPKAAARQVFDARVAWLISDILSDDLARMIGFGRNSTLQIERPAAVKTGTTTNYHDNWTIGYTPDLVVGVWVGNSDYQAMRNVNGLTGAAPIWQETIRALLRGKPETAFERPDGMLKEKVCTISGLLVTPLCEHSAEEWFIDGTQPLKPDDVYTQIWLDASTGRLATDQTPAAKRVAKVVLNLPIQAQRWAHSQGLDLLSDFVSSAGNTARLLITSPQDGSNYFLTDQLTNSGQQLAVEISADASLNEITLRVDGVSVAAFSTGQHVFWWQLAPGTHLFQLEGIDSSGQVVRSDPVEITVSK